MCEKRELSRTQKDHSQTPFLVTMNDIFNHRSFRYKQVNYHSICTIWSNIHSTFLGSVRRDCTLLLFSSRLRKHNAVIHRDCAIVFSLRLGIPRQCSSVSAYRQLNYNLFIFYYGKIRGIHKTNE